MSIERVKSLQTTSMSLNDRFTMLASGAPQRATRPRSNNVSGFLNRSNNINTEDLLTELIIKKLQQRVGLRSVKQRLNMGNRIQRYGGQNKLPLRRFSSSSNLSQRVGFKTGGGVLRRFNNNLSSSMSFGNLTRGSRQKRGVWRRSGSAPPARSMLRGGRLQVQRILGQTGNQTQTRKQNMRGRTRGRGRGRNSRNQMNRKPILTKEQLDAQLDEYIAGTNTMFVGDT